jgi:methylmalonyl-CoA mutase C-terminal domain/subunit
MTQRKRPIRVLIAKPGLDGHDRGAKVLTRALRDAGMEVIYTGLRQSPEQIVSAAIQEDVDIVGLSILSGAHLGLTRKVIDQLNNAGATEKKVLVGGTIPRADIAKMMNMGVAGVFPRTPSSEIIKFIQDLMQEDG